jgi:hypothetical protein
MLVPARLNSFTHLRAQLVLHGRGGGEPICSLHHRTGLIPIHAVGWYSMTDKPPPPVPTTLRYTVSSGDTLSDLAARYGAYVRRCPGGHVTVYPVSRAGIRMDNSDISYATVSEYQ